MVVAVVCMGSNFVPLKGIRIGDGIFFQFCMCNAIFITSIPVLMIQSFPPIHGLALFGGFLWCTGNMLCPLAIKFIGMGLGLILWGCTSMLFGWASGTFGLFGLTKQEINDPVLNIVGVVISMLGFFVYMQVRTDDTSVDAKRFTLRKAQMEYRKRIIAQTQNESMQESFRHTGTDDPHDLRQSLIQEDNPRPSVAFRDTMDENPRPSVTFRDEAERPSALFRRSTVEEDFDMERPSVVNQQRNGYGAEGGYDEGEEGGDENAPDEYNPFAFRTERLFSDQSNLTGLSTKSRSIGDDWSVERKRFVGMMCAIVAGIFFGCSFDPSQWVIDNKFDGNDNSLNYVFSQFLGVLMTSWFYTIVYSVYHLYRGSKPYINAESILPATFSGIVRGIALIAWFTANGELGFPITFPIVTAGPGLVGALWGIFVFKEIRGKRNFLVLGAAVSVTMLSMALIAMSR